MAATSKFVRALHMSTKISSSFLTNSLQRQSALVRCRCLLSTKPTDQPEAEQTESKTEATESKDDQLSAEVKKLQEDVKDIKRQETEVDLETQIQSLTEEMKMLQDRYMRALAETENLRKRMTKQVDDAKTFGIQGFCKDLLEVSDILSTAITTVPKEELKDSNPHLMNLFQGLNMTESQLIKVFKKHGLESIAPSEGEKFDPHVHEAMFQVPIQEKEIQVADTVAVVQKNGFKLHDRTLRPALVGVFKGP